MVAQGASWVASLLASVWAGGRAMISVVSLIVVTPVVAFYLLYDWDRMLARIDGLIPREHARYGAADSRATSTLAHRRVHPRAGRPLPDPRPVLRHRALVGRAEFRLSDRLGCRPRSASFRSSGPSSASCVAVGVALVQFWPNWIWIVVSGRNFWRRAVPGGQHPAAAAGRIEHRRAPRLAHVRAVRLRLAVRLRRRAAGRSGDGSDRRARPLRRRPLPAQPDLSGAKAAARRPGVCPAESHAGPLRSFPWR